MRDQWEGWASSCLGTGTEGRGLQVGSSCSSIPWNNESDWEDWQGSDDASDLQRAGDGRQWLCRRFLFESESQYLALAGLELAV